MPPKGVSAAELLPVFRPIIPASRFSSILHILSTFFVKAYDAGRRLVDDLEGT